MGKFRKPLVAFIIALFVFVSFVGLTYFYIAQATDLDRVVVAARPIPPRTEITPDLLKTIEMPRGYIPIQAARSIDNFKVTTYYTGEIGLNEGDVVTQTKVFTAEYMRDGHVLELGPNETILGVSTNLVRSAGASIYSGSRVRALACIPAMVEEGIIVKPQRTEIIFDNLRVVEVVNNEGANTSQDERRRLPSVVKLAVDPVQERVLIQYQNDYDIWFTVLPENYEPSPELEDYYYRKKYNLGTYNRLVQTDEPLNHEKSQPDIPARRF